MTRIQPFPAPFAEKARAALPRPAGTAVFVLTHEARSALCGRFGLEDSQLDHALGLLGASRVEDPDAPDGPIEADAAELLAQPDIDGGLIGGASLKPDDFLAIINAANQE